MCCACDNPDKPYESPCQNTCVRSETLGAACITCTRGHSFCAAAASHGFITHADHNAKEMHARCMRHNWTIAETNYRKPSIEQNRKGAFNEQGEIVPAAAAARACSSCVTACSAQTLLHEQASEMHQTVPNILADASRCHAHTVHVVLCVL